MKKWIKGVLIAVASVIMAVVLGAFILMVMAVRFNGMWKMEAYGFCFDIKAGIAKVYEVTDHSYTRRKQYDGVIINGTLYSGLGKLQLKLTGEQLSLVDKGSQVVYPLFQQGADYFTGLEKVEEDDPVSKFRMYYEIFEENYAFADLYGVNLSEEYQTYASIITKDTTDETLYQYMCDMVAKLDDGHISVSLNGKEYCPSDYEPEWIKDQEQINLLGSVIKEDYVKDYYKFEDCFIRYGTMRADIGYIIIQGVGMTELDKVKTTKKAMNQIIDKFKDKKTVVIDLRFCSGGFDEASLLIAGYFTSDRYLAYKKQAYYKGEFTQLQNIYVNPNKLTYDGNIVILTSGYTISAGETLIRALLANPEQKITMVGEETAGYYSDSIVKELPGGFEFRMSTERYFGFDDTMLEGKGIVPEIVIPIDRKDTQTRKDKALDWVLENY